MTVSVLKCSKCKASHSSCFSSAYLLRRGSRPPPADILISSPSTSSGSQHGRLAPCSPTWLLSFNLKTPATSDSCKVAASRTEYHCTLLIASQRCKILHQTQGRSSHGKLTGEHSLCCLANFQQYQLQNCTTGQVHWLLGSMRPRNAN